MGFSAAAFWEASRSRSRSERAFSKLFSAKLSRARRFATAMRWRARSLASGGSLLVEALDRDPLGFLDPLEEDLEEDSLDRVFLEGTDLTSCRPR